MDRVTAEMSDLTYEDIIDGLLDLFRRTDSMPAAVSPTPWDSFLRLSTLIHKTYEVPSTTFTPVMRRLLFALSYASQARNIVGVGTYVGYTFSWLLRDRTDPETAPYCEMAVGIDIDSNANELARRNCDRLGHGRRLTFIDGDGEVAIANSDWTIDLLYLDLDDPATGKSGYKRVLETALDHLRPGALVLAHDPCVPAFRQDFDSYNDFVNGCEMFSRSWILPIDACGLAVAVVR
ncbi:MAG TPA: class I SAM-dependent methyltransferase [Pyrinomonadaceae bacterium]|nr:class I SAM-dependent methyltransferase [Pyrinomonadaceae bacterium]